MIVQETLQTTKTKTTQSIETETTHIMETETFRITDTETTDDESHTKNTLIIIFITRFFLENTLIFIGFLYIFEKFWSYIAKGTTGRAIPPPFTIREFSVLNRLKI